MKTNRRFFTGGVHRLTRLSLSAVLVVALVQPSVAITIMDSTWAAYGGTDEDFDAGFAPFSELAEEPQFGAAGLAMTREDFDGVVGCSGTWLGNDDEYGYVLSAAHCLPDSEDDPSWLIGNRPDYDFSTTSWHVGDDVYSVVAAYVHPYWSGFAGDTGADLVVFAVDRPIEGIADPVRLYCGVSELKSDVVMVGYGGRDLRSALIDDDFGDETKFRSGDIKTAAENLIDEVFDNGNSLMMDIDTDVAQAEEEDADAFEPVGELEGKAAKGDSGGGVFMEADDGWVQIAVNSGGFGFGSWPARISTQYDFISSAFAGAIFVDGEGGDCADSLHATSGIIDIYTMNEFDECYEEITNYQDWMDGTLTADDAEDQFNRAVDLDTRKYEFFNSDDEAAEDPGDFFEPGFCE